MSVRSGRRIWPDRMREVGLAAARLASIARSTGDNHVAFDGNILRVVAQPVSVEKLRARIEAKYSPILSLALSRRPSQHPTAAQPRKGPPTHTREPIPNDSKTSYDLQRLRTLAQNGLDRLVLLSPLPVVLG